ncbi:hypothetical protein ACWDHH_15735 [Janibacter hoylei]
MPAVDTTRAPKGELAAIALVEAVVANDDRVERHFLEIKSQLDLTTRKDQAKLAKFILGAANRMPDQANRAFEGYGVMVIGASDGQMPGIPPIEALDIERAVRPFLGADGPRYDFVRVPCESSKNEVLVLLVDPPEVGQAPFVCRKSGDGGLRDGAVFVRADGETREANSGELQQLLERGMASTPSVNFGVGIVGVVHPATVDQDEILEEYISRTRAELVAPLRKEKPSATAERAIGGSFDEAISQQIRSISNAYSLRSSLTMEKRSEAEFLESIDDWADRTREAWPDAVLRLIGAATPVEVEVRNHEKTFFHDVEVKIHIEGDVSGSAAWKPSGRLWPDDLDLPSPPRKWGEVAPLLGSGLTYMPPPRFNSVVMSRTSWNNSGSVDLEVSVGEVRPTGVVITDDEEVVLYTTDRSLTSATGTWQITARDHNDVYAGELEVEIGQPLDLTRVLRRILGLDKGE